MKQSIEDNLKIELTSMFGSLFQSHGQQAIGIFNHIHQNYIITCIQNPTLLNMKSSVFLVDDSLEFLGEWIPVEI